MTKTVRLQIEYHVINIVNAVLMGLRGKEGGFGLTLMHIQMERGSVHRISRRENRTSNQPHIPKLSSLLSKAEHTNRDEGPIKSIVNT